MNYTTYLFDFDYTLADSSRGIVTCFQNVLNRHGFTSVTDLAIKHTIGKPLEESFTLLSGITDAVQLADFKKEYVKEADVHMTVNTVLFLETKSVLSALKDAGARIGIISTKYRYRIKELIDLHFSGDFFDIIIGGEDVSHPKPSPEGILQAIKQLHIPKADVLYIGDSTVDAETAQAAGVDFAGVLHGITTEEELRTYPHKMILKTLGGLLNNNERLADEKPPVSKRIIGNKKRFSPILLTILKYIRALHIKQIRGQQPLPASPNTTVCKNCGTTYTGNFCNRCGQQRNTSRFTFRSAIKSALGGISNIDSGFGRTLIELLYRPGYMINDFISGKRINYFRPFQTLFVLTALYILSVQLIDPVALKREQSKASTVQTDSLNIQQQETVSDSASHFKEEEDIIDDVVNTSLKLDNSLNKQIGNSPFLKKVWNLLSNWAHGNKAVNIICTLPLFALASRMAFRKRTFNRKFNYTEHIFAQTYMACQLLLISILILSFTGKASISDIYNIPHACFFLLFCWDYKQLFRGSWWQSFKRTLLMFWYSLLFLILLAIIIAFFLIGGALLLKAWGV